MKLFDFLQVPPKSMPYLKITADATGMMIEIAKELDISLYALHAALWVFHCNAIIMTYHNFDRYIYACGALLVGTKMMECLRSPVSIIERCRQKLRDRKKLEDKDFKGEIDSQIKKVFEAEVNIMINIGFDLDVLLALQLAEQYRLSRQLDEHLYNAFKQTLTSLYKTEVVVLFEPIIIICLSLDIVVKSQGRNIELLQINSALKSVLQGSQLKQAKKQYLARSGYF